MSSSDVEHFFCLKNSSMYAYIAPLLLMVGENFVSVVCMLGV